MLISAALKNDLSNGADEGAKDFQEFLGRDA
jgi:hypothetical protein